MTTNAPADLPETMQAGDRRLVFAGNDAYRRARVASRLMSAARDAGVELTASYARRLAAGGLSRCGQLGVTRLGDGVVVHTAPESDQEPLVVLGYADAAGEWFRDGRRHNPPGVGW